MVEPTYHRVGPVRVMLPNTTDFPGSSTRDSSLATVHIHRNIPAPRRQRGHGVGSGGRDPTQLRAPALDAPVVAEVAGILQHGLDNVKLARRLRVDLRDLVNVRRDRRRRAPVGRVVRHVRAAGRRVVAVLVHEACRSARSRQVRRAARVPA